MSLKKRGSVWHIDVTVGGRRVQESARTSDRSKAQEYHDSIRAQLWREVKLGERRVFTWYDAVKLYTSERQHLRQMHRQILPTIEWLSDRIPDDTPLDQIGRDTIARIRLDRANQKTSTGKMPAQATVNFTMAILSAILNLARRHDMVAAVPVIETPNPQNGRSRWLTRQEADAMLAQLDGVVRDAAEFSLETGLRQMNVLRLRWDWIRMDSKTLTVPAAEFKGQRPLTIPLSDRAVAILGAAMARNRHQEFVFVSDDGRLLNSHINETLAAACKAVGIDDFRWHDLRHTWATWHVRAGTPLEVLQKLGGWRDYRMVLRYAVFAQDHLATYANQLRRDIQVTDSNNVVPIKGAA
jgi:integrase